MYEAERVSVNTSGVGMQCFTLMEPQGSCLSQNDVFLGNLCAQSDVKIVMQLRIVCNILFHC